MDEYWKPKNEQIVKAVCYSDATSQNRLLHRLGQHKMLLSKDSVVSFKIVLTT